MALRATNNAWGLLSTAMNAQTTSLTLQAGHSARFPVLKAGDWFYVTVFDNTGNQEIMKVTATLGDQFTVVRAVDGTTPQLWAAAVRVQGNITVAAWNDFNTDLSVIPTQQRTFAAPIVLNAAPTAATHAATRKYVTDNKMPKTTALQAPIGFSPVRQYANKTYFGWSAGECYLQIDGVFQGAVLRDTTFNPATKANNGAQLQWNTGIYQTGALDAFNGFGAVDLGSPWVMEGIGCGLSIDGLTQSYYLRLIWYRNQ